VAWWRGVAPEVEVKGEGAHYFLLVQGSEAGGGGGGGGACRARMLHSANQINGAAAVATVDGLLREKSLASGILCTCVCVCVCRRARRDFPASHAAAAAAFHLKALTFPLLTFATQNRTIEIL